MKNEELHRLLRSVNVPERPPAYWEEFPASVIRGLQRAPGSGSTSSVRRAPKLAWGLGLAAACVMISLAIGSRWGRHSPPGSVPRSELSKYFREIEELFPGQLQAIVFDEAGPRLLLSETSNVPSSPPVFVRICGSKGCRGYITFSGQRVRMNGDEFEILVDAQGGVIVVGGKAVWSSAGARSARLPYRIEASRVDSLM